MIKDFDVSKAYFKDNKLISFPSKENKKHKVIEYISNNFIPEGTYKEKEINEILKNIYDDYVLLRRYLVDYKFLNRTKDCRTYWK